jgi:hypothetical protein
MMRALRSQIALFSALGLLSAIGATLMLSHPISTKAIRTEEKRLKFEDVRTRIDIPATNSRSLAEIQARPLFSRSRRPYEAPVSPITAPSPETSAIPPAEAAPAIAAEALVLKGVLLKPPLSKAFIVSPANAQGIWAPLGAQIEGWKIVEVTASGVRLTQQQQSAVLMLYPGATSP